MSEPIASHQRYHQGITTSPLNNLIEKDQHLVRQMLLHQRLAISLAVLSDKLGMVLPVLQLARQQKRRVN